MLFLVQLNIAGGVSSGYWVCYGSSRIDSSIQWRLPFIISTVLAVSVAVGAAFLPHSPRWLLLHNRRADAERVLDKLVGDSVEDMAERREMLAVTIAPKGSKRAAAVAMWRKDVRWRSCLGIGIQMLQMLSGMCVHTFLYLSSPPSVSLTLIDLPAATLCAFPPATSRSSSPSLTSPRPQPLLRRQPLPAGGPDGRDGKLPRRRLDRHLRCVLSERARAPSHEQLALTSAFLHPAVLLGTIVNYFYVDRAGRRTIFVTGGAVVGTALFVIGSMYASGAAATERGKWVVIVFIEIYAFSFAASWGVVTRLCVPLPLSSRVCAGRAGLTSGRRARSYSAEIQPSRTRAAAASVSVASNQLTNFIGARSFLVLARCILQELMRPLSFSRAHRSGLPRSLRLRSLLHVRLLLSPARATCR
mgnify:FL=1